MFKILLFIHILFGFTALLLGAFILLYRKGNIIHKKIGAIYFYAMLFNSIAGVLMSYFKDNLFLLVIGVFSLYLCITGYRAIQIHNSKSAIKLFDKIVLYTMLVLCFVFLVLGISTIYNKNSFGIVLLVFGSISSLMVRNDLKKLSNKTKYQNPFLLLHIQKMSASFIAALTAFIVVNNLYLPPIIAWLLPSILVTPFIFIWSKKNKIIK
jgi:uncharacterized membrane protein